MTKRLAVVVACTAVFVTGCGGDSSDEVRSGSGPSPATSPQSDDDASGTASEAPPSTSEHLEVRGDFDIPEGVADTLSVVIIGKPDGDSVPVVVRNRTAESLSSLEVTGTSRGADGNLMGSGASQGFAPEILGPGEWAFGYVYFDSGKLRPDTEFDLTATGDTPDDVLDAVDVRVAEVNLVKGEYGEQFVGIVENPTDAEVSGPIDVMVGCFDDGGTLISTYSDYTESDSLPPGGTSSFSIDLFDEPCPQWAMGGSGYNF